MKILGHSPGNYFPTQENGTFSSCCGSLYTKITQHLTDNARGIILTDTPDPSLDQETDTLTIKTIQTKNGPVQVSIRKVY